MVNPLNTRRAERGLTLIEVATVLAVLSVLGAIIASGVMHYIYKARLSRCLNEMRSIQSTLWPLWSEGNPPTPEAFWNDRWGGHAPGPYYYIPNTNDGNSGHGNDFLDRCDEDNNGAGTARRNCQDITYLLVCQHDHGPLARYVWLEGQQAPQLATDANDPHWDLFIDVDKKGNPTPGKPDKPSDEDKGPVGRGNENKPGGKGQGGK